MNKTEQIAALERIEKYLAEGEDNHEMLQYENGIAAMERVDIELIDVLEALRAEVQAEQLKSNVATSKEILGTLQKIGPRTPQPSGPLIVEPVLGMLTRAKGLDFMNAQVMSTEPEYWADSYMGVKLKSGSLTEAADPTEQALLEERQAMLNRAQNAKEPG